MEMTTNQDALRHYAIEVKPIGAACNLRCEYCYYLGKEKTLSSPAAGGAGALMSDEVLERYIQQVIAIHGQLKFFRGAVSKLLLQLERSAFQRF